MYVMLYGMFTSCHLKVSPPVTSQRIIYHKTTILFGQPAGLAALKHPVVSCKFTLSIVFLVSFFKKTLWAMKNVISRICC